VDLALAEVAPTSAATRSAAALALALLPARALGADYELAIEQIDLTPEPAGVSLYFGNDVAGGDFDGDGYADVAIGAFGRRTVYVYPGSPEGLGRAWIQALEPLDSDPTRIETWGGGLAAVDLDADGDDELVVAAGESNTVFIYEGGPGGVARQSEYYLVPAGAFSGSPGVYGGVIASAGDTDGDGFDDLLVGRVIEASAADALYVYPGGAGGVDRCGERELRLRESWPESGGLSAVAATGDGDANGDGYADVADGCFDCGDPDRVGGQPSGRLILWDGGPLGVGEYNASVVGDCCVPDLVSDLDGDGFDDLVLRSHEHDAWVYWGGTDSINEDRRERLSDAATAVAGLGDVDGDGLGDLLVGYGWGPEDEVSLVFGDPGRRVDPPGVTMEHQTEVDEGWGYGVFALGDVNRDGHQDFAAAARYAGMYEGWVSVYIPTCTWYADADGDGHGDPAVPLDTCHDPGTGWARHGDDCDDTDASAVGGTWFADADRDGHGTRAAAVLACEQPGGSSPSWHDCDDEDAARSPDLPDSTADGIDQDCDGHDGPWSWDTGACPEEPADTGDDAETGAEPGAEPECGCATGPGGATPALLLGVAALLRRTRRPH